MKYTHKFILLATIGLAFAEAAPIDDLASPDQAIRDKAATELRATFKNIPETKWMPTVDEIQKGQSKKAILGLLGPDAKEEWGMGSGQSHSQSYRLDDEWVLICWFRNDGDILIDHKLEPRLRHVWTAPSSDFTGTWVVYFVNGRKSHEIEYRDGRYFGTFIAYRPDGSRLYIQHHTTEGADGEGTGYYASGSISYRIQYRAGKQVGTWTWYDENGKITSTEEHPKE